MATAHASIRRPDRKERISVLLPLPLGGVYDYAVAPGMEVLPGDFVTVPLGRRHVTGVVWGEATYEVGDEKLKEIEGLLDLPRMPEDLRLLVDWVASYTLSPAGAVLRMAMSVPAALEPPLATTAYLASPDALSGKTDSGARITDARRRVLDALAGGPPRAAAAAARAAGVSPSVIRGMADAGLLKSISVHQAYDRPQPDWQLPGPTLSAAQGEAASGLRRAVSVSVAALKSGEDGGFSVTLLDGVTGSGKTEVYFEAIAETLAAGRQALVLLPEIALTAQWLERFKARFGVIPLEWHSDIGAAARRLGWRAVISGQASVVVGARSALFLPFASLGLIVVDEEHDASFKQEEGVIYNARDMAVVRGRVGAFPVVLSSATPSLETVTNVEADRYQMLSLPERHAGASMPGITAIDMRGQQMGRQSWLSPALQDAMTATLEANDQVMLFLNRRGYAPLTLCRHCGNRLQCPNCTAWLVEHKSRGRLECHHCGLSIRPPSDCPECGETDSLAACGPGVERLAEEVKPAFPDARVEIMASDTVNSPAEVASLVHRMQEREIDILIGTQIMAKGHHFPRLTLVGVIDADLGLAGGDLRAAERTFQLLHQVSGRAGRAEHPGSVILQTYEPEHPVLEALVSGGRDRFLAAEAAERRRHHMPPFGRLVALIVSGVDRGAVEATARSLARSRPAMDGVEVFGPAPAPMALLRGRQRWRLLLKARRGKNVQNIVRDWLTRVRIPGNVRVQIDVDPFSFL